MLGRDDEMIAPRLSIYYVWVTLFHTTFCASTLGGRYIHTYSLCTYVYKALHNFFFFDARDIWNNVYAPRFIFFCMLWWSLLVSVNQPCGSTYWLHLYLHLLMCSSRHTFYAPKMFLLVKLSRVFFLWCFIWAVPRHCLFVPFATPWCPNQSPDSKWCV